MSQQLVDHRPSGVVIVICRVTGLDLSGTDEVQVLLVSEQRTDLYLAHAGLGEGRNNHRCRGVVGDIHVLDCRVRAQIVDGLAGKRRADVGPQEVERTKHAIGTTSIKLVDRAGHRDTRGVLLVGENEDVGLALGVVDDPVSNLTTGVYETLRDVKQREDIALGHRHCRVRLTRT